MIEEIVSKLVEHFSKINFRRVKFFFFKDWVINEVEEYRKNVNHLAKIMERMNVRGIVKIKYYI